MIYLNMLCAMYSAQWTIDTTLIYIPNKSKTWNDFTGLKCQTFICKFNRQNNTIKYNFEIKCSTTTPQYQTHEKCTTQGHI